VKKISVLFIATMFLFGCADSNANDTNDTNGLIWYTNVEKAVEIAKKEDKRVLVQFSGSDWCKWCIKLNDEVFNKKDFADYAKDKMILVNLDFPRTIAQTDEVKEYNRSMANKYGVRGFPTVLLLDKEGNLVKKTGYQRGGPNAYVEHIKESYNPEGSI